MTADSSIFGFRPNPSMVDFPGRLAAVFFTSGCNFRCGFCHNTSIMRTQGAEFSWDRLRSTCERFRDDWVDGAVVTGGEPTLAPNLLDLLRFLKGFGFAVKLDTNGSHPEVLTEALPEVDCVAMDVKCALDSYPALTDFHHPDRIARSVDLLRSGATDYEFRTTVIGSFHTDDEMRGIADLIAPARRYVLQPFVPQDDLPDPSLRGEPRTSPDRLEALSELMRDCADEVIVRGT